MKITRERKRTRRRTKKGQEQHKGIMNRKRQRESKRTIKKVNEIKGKNGTFFGRKRKAKVKDTKAEDKGNKRKTKPMGLRCALLIGVVGLYLTLLMGLEIPLHPCASFQNHNFFRSK